MAKAPSSEAQQMRLPSLGVQNPADLYYPVSDPGQLICCLEQAGGVGALEGFVEWLPLCCQEREVKDLSGASSPRGRLMAPGRACYALAILLAVLDTRSGGCIHITSSASQEGTQLNLTCTLWHTKEEAEGCIVFLCKDRSLDCSPETSLQQLRLKRHPGKDDGSKISSQLVFTKNQVVPSDNGTYQCCARCQKPEMTLQGHSLSVQVTETGNFTVTGPKTIQHPAFGHNAGVPRTGFLPAQICMLLLTSLVVPQVL
ncbi:CD160 antigen [Lepus europaeus]|uniref:CD160 antigen n=1 Tax=Lepus europaeus TaxID=9983 RepID=UPI002B462BEE|nr:CD160 antigen [Lepus europaeus]